FSPAPRREAPAGATMPTTPSILSNVRRLASTLGQRHRDKAQYPAGLDPHQDAVLVVGTRGVDRLAHIAGIGDILAGDLENHIAFLEAALGRRTLRIELGDHDAFL